MAEWYIDRSLNLESFYNSVIYKRFVDNIDEILESDLSSNELIKVLGIVGKNPNATLTYMRDIGILDIKNKPTEFILDAINTNCKNNFIILLSLIKRDDKKNDKSNIKPFVLICKYLSLLNKLGKPLFIDLNICKNYLCKIQNYHQMTEEYALQLSSIKFVQIADKSVFDIWINALVSTGLFKMDTLTKQRIILDEKYIKFIEYIAKYGNELKVSQNKEEYFNHLFSSKHGLCQLVLDHLNESIEALDSLNGIFDYINYVNKCVCNDVGYNRIYYGIPGCGKSYYVEHTILKGVNKDNIFRTTFYLDYMNSDFVGQIYPIVDKNKNVRYELVPGPFTCALEKAYNNPNNMIYLIIEEINRGNAAAIFGDIFQLLDRIDENTISMVDDDRLIGDSEYPINNDFVSRYFLENNTKNYKAGDKVYIPRNLTIIATMNTSDQNVFSLDTAFKRRWDRERINVNWNSVDETFKNMYIPLTDLTWEQFATKVNSILIKQSQEGLILSDKQLGPYFINKDLLATKAEKDDVTNELNKKKLKKFINNVIDYLYNDVTKFDHNILFKENVSYDDIYNIMLDYMAQLELGEVDSINESLIEDGKSLCMTIFSKVD